MRVKYGAMVVLSLFLLATSACGRSDDSANDSTVSTLVPSAATPVPTVLAETVTSAPPAEITYVIQAGDSLSSVAERFGVTLQDLADFNAIEDPNSIKEGQELVIPPVLSAPVTVVEGQVTVPAEDG